MCRDRLIRVGEDGSGSEASVSYFPELTDLAKWEDGRAGRGGSYLSAIAGYHHVAYCMGRLNRTC